MFDLRFFVGYMMEQYTYYYLIAGLLCPICFLTVPPSRKLKAPWDKRALYLDLFFGIIAFVCCVYLAINARNIYMLGWERLAPTPAKVASVVMWVLIMEMSRRSAGNVITIFIFLFSLLPLYTQYLPGFLNGLHKDFLLTMQMHILGTDSAMGTLLRTFADIVIPYTIFGTVIVLCGGGDFFLNLAISLFGRFRGGTGKVAVVSSALFGSISGNPVVNVITTGSVTIPAMKKTGFDPETAGAVEACASTAGTMTPPIMGTASFVMAAFLGINYSEVAIAAICPIMLYYIAILLQLDMYAAKKGLRGLTKSEMPDMKETFKDGWTFIPTMAILLYGIFALRRIPESAIAASLVSIVLAQFNPKTRFNGAVIKKLLYDTGINCMEVLAVMLGVGCILGSFSMTGIGISFPRELYQLAGGNTVLLVILTAVASLIMGMGMTTIACYIFLSIVIAPALELAGLNQLAVHMFLLYCGMLSYITPPVAVATIPAGMLAKTSSTKVGMRAVRLGSSLFLVPFFFISDPALLLKGSVIDVVTAIITAVTGITMLCMSMEGYVFKIGELKFSKPINLMIRVMLFMSAVFLGVPGWETDIIGIIIAVVTLIPTYLLHNKNRSSNIVA